MPLHDAPRRCETESASGELCWEERIETFRQRIGVHPDSGVRHFEIHIPSIGERIAAEYPGAIAVIDQLHARAQHDAAGPILECVGGIGQDIHHDLSQLRGVGRNR